MVSEAGASVAGFFGEKLKYTFVKEKKKIKSYSIEDMHALAHNRGGECLAEVYVNGEIKMPWRCSCGFQWKMAPKTVLRGHWCPRCGAEKASQSRKFPFDEIVKIVQSKGGRILSSHEEYRNKYSILAIQCHHGLQFKSRARNIRSGGWCRHEKAIPKSKPIIIKQNKREIERERKRLERLKKADCPPKIERSNVLLYDHKGTAFYGPSPIGILSIKKVEATIVLKNSEGLYVEKIQEWGIFNAKGFFCMEKGKLFEAEHICKECSNKITLKPIYIGTTTFYCGKCGDSVKAIVSEVEIM